MRNYLVVSIAAAALSVSTVATPANADHSYNTYCNNENTDMWIPLDEHKGVGVDRFNNGDYVLCIRTGLTGEQYQMIIIRPGRTTTICTVYSNDYTPNDTCFYV